MVAHGSSGVGFEYFFNCKSSSQRCQDNCRTGWTCSDWMATCTASRRSSSELSFQQKNCYIIPDCGFPCGLEKINDQEEIKANTRKTLNQIHPNYSKISLHRRLCLTRQLRELFRQRLVSDALIFAASNRLMLQDLCHNTYKLLQAEKSA